MTRLRRPRTPPPGLTLEEFDAAVDLYWQNADHAVCDFENAEAVVAVLACDPFRDDPVLGSPRPRGWKPRDQLTPAELRKEALEAAFGPNSVPARFVEEDRCVRPISTKYHWERQHGARCRNPRRPGLDICTSHWKADKRETAYLLKEHERAVVSGIREQNGRPSLAQILEM